MEIIHILKEEVRNIIQRQELWDYQQVSGIGKVRIHSSDSSQFGIAGDASVATNMVGTSNNYLGYTSEQWSLYNASGVYYNGASTTSYGVAVAYGDIIGIYFRP